MIKKAIRFGIAGAICAATLLVASLLTVYMLLTGKELIPEEENERRWYVVPDNE